MQSRELISLFFSLLRYGLLETPLEPDFPEVLTEEMLQKLYSLSEKHDLAHLIGDALYRCGRLPKESPTAAKLQKAQMIALYRYTQLEHQRAQICQALQEAQIPYVPLKGIIVRPYYPKPHLRTSCDLDILVHQEDVPRAVEHLTAVLRYTKDQQISFHDVSLHSPGGLHLELHFSIESNKEPLDKVLSRVWDYCTPMGEDSFEYRQSPEIFMFHQIAHMATHFLNGGCGVRPLADLYLLTAKMSFDEDEVLRLCRESDTEVFYGRVKELSRVWFGGQPHSEATRRMEAFILFGGVYGTLSNSVAVRYQQQSDQKNGPLHRIFMPYRILKSKYHMILPYHILKNKYPILVKHKWLYPVMTVRRWFNLLLPFHWRRVRLEFKESSSMTEEKQQGIELLLSDLGLTQV